MAAGLVGLICSSGCMVWEWKKHRSFPAFSVRWQHWAWLFFWSGCWRFLPCGRRWGSSFLLGAGVLPLEADGAHNARRDFVRPLLELVAGEIARRPESRLLSQRYELAQSGFENLRRHQEEVMMPTTT
ncbi:MAG: hypothetical protein V8S08_10580 [Lachnoclostridium sp.]